MVTALSLEKAGMLQCYLRPAVILVIFCSTYFLFQIIAVFLPSFVYIGYPTIFCRFFWQLSESEVL